MYYAQYFAATRSETGCVKEFVTTCNDNKFLVPQTVLRYCNLCSKEHRFNLRTTYTANTPNQVKRFIEYCDKQNIETNVQLT